jgi:hypothetical protein
MGIYLPVRDIKRENCSDCGMEGIAERGGDGQYQAASPTLVILKLQNLLWKYRVRNRIGAES